jgi:hypothetical protein
MNNSRYLWLVAAGLSASLLSGQSGPVWSAGPIEFSGLVDGYYSFNFNHPASRTNNYRNFDAKANQLSLNFAKFTMEHGPDPVGFKLELAAGRAMEIFHATEPAGSEVYKHLYQAYVSVKPASWKGFQFDFGKFNTSAGAEVTETHLNWNYSRSLLFANGPYYHFGARTTVPLHKHFTAGFQLVNGWNNVEDNNSGKTVGLTGALTTSKFNWFNNYYFGPEKTNSNEGFRHFWDTVVNINPTEQFNFLFNFDYGQENMPKAAAQKFYGLSTAVRLMPKGGRTAFSPRYTWYRDRDGFITGTPRTWQEFTLTADYRMAEGFLTRLEYRRDWSDQPFFDRGAQVANHKNMDTLLVGFIVYFGPKR